MVSHFCTKDNWINLFVITISSTKVMNLFYTMDFWIQVFQLQRQEAECRRRLMSNIPNGTGPDFQGQVPYT